MTEPYGVPPFTLARQFHDALNDQHRADFKMSGVTHLPLLQQCADRGWLMTDLAVYCSTRPGGSPRDFTGIVTHRLRMAATEVKPKPAAVSLRTSSSGLAKFTQPKPWCGQCDGQYTRRIEDPETGRPTGRHCECWTPPPRA